jgi:Rad3-related DNA helicase
MASTILDSSSPSDFSFPPKFQSFRQIQRELVDFSVYGSTPHLGPRRFHAAGAPTGCGKSLAAQTIGELIGGRYVTMTATKPLQDQYLDDQFPALVDIRGRGNYDCIDKDLIQSPSLTSGFTTKVKCDVGAESGCEWEGTKHCTSSKQIELVKQARSVLTNYQYWMHARAYNMAALEQPGGDLIKTLICDEVQKAPEELARFLGTWVSHNDLRKYSEGRYLEALRRSNGKEWGRIEGVNSDWLPILTSVSNGHNAELRTIATHYDSITEARRSDKKFRQLEKQIGELDRILQLGTDGNWIWRQTKHGTAFDCVWPGRYANRYLWSGIERLVLLSGTLRPKCLQLLGIPDSKRWFKEWPRVFPPQLSPVYWLPVTDERTGKLVKTGYRSGVEDLDRLVWMFDRVAEEWQGAKGLIHTASYQRAEWLQSKSKFGRHMILNESGGAVEAAQKYRKASAPAMLVSPSYTAGWDFPDEQCAWNVVLKLPFPNKSDPVVQARLETDADWYNYETMQTFVQACGRGSRHERDRCVTMVLDNAVKGFRWYAKEHAPSWFGVQERKTLPRAA